MAGTSLPLPEDVNQDVAEWRSAWDSSCPNTRTRRSQLAAELFRWKTVLAAAEVELHERKLLCEIFFWLA